MNDGIEYIKIKQHKYNYNHALACKSTLSNFQRLQTINSGSNTTIILLHVANNVTFSTFVSK